MRGGVTPDCSVNGHVGDAQAPPPDAPAVSGGTAAPILELHTGLHGGDDSFVAAANELDCDGLHPLPSEVAAGVLHLIVCGLLMGRTQSLCLDICSTHP